MVKNKPGWTFPSGIANEIEKPLRRKFRSEKKIDLYVTASVILFLIGLTILYFLVAQVVDNQATQLELLKKAKAESSLCKQYLEDTKLIGTAAEDTLNEICI